MARKKTGYGVRVYGKPRNPKDRRAYKDWYVVISKDGEDIEHIRAQPNTTAQAKTLADQKRRELHVGNYVANADDITFAEAARQFLESFEARTRGPNADRSPSTYTIRETNLRVHLLPEFGHVKLSQIPSLLPSYIDRVKERYAADTVRTIFVCVHVVLKFAHMRLGFPDLLHGVKIELPTPRKLGGAELIKFEDFHAMLVFME
jgi:hypothetical protein